MRTLMVVVLAGCGPTGADRREPLGSDLEGVYEVVAREHGDCASPAAAAIQPAWFEVEVSRVGGENALVLTPCASEACASPGAPTYFDSFDDFSASGEAKSTSFAGTTCTFDWYEDSLDAVGGELVFTTRRSQVEGVDGVDLDDCFEQHDAWTGATPCVELDIRTAARAR